MRTQLRGLGVPPPARQTRDHRNDDGRASDHHERHHRAERRLDNLRTAPQHRLDKNWSEEGFADQTARQVVRVTGSGTAARVRFSNRFGSAPLEVGGTTLARTAQGAAVRTETTRRLAFSGTESVRIPAGGEVWSDAAELPVTPFDQLTVSLYFPRRPAPPPSTPRRSPPPAAPRATG
ncbi:hypothetical protein [Streptomyces sp. Ac-502]|uniref:hypothetical protein n=1 Tax=Streptomyces sp. Ac-502 TaxID=3342801 RepID=UPI0038629B09